MKKLFALLLTLAMLLSLAACGGPAEQSSEDDNEIIDVPVSEDGAETVEPEHDHSGYKVAIVQQLDHASLDEIRLAVEAELQEAGAAQGVEVEVQEFNGQNDPTILAQIGSQVVDGGFDAVVPIATLAAQSMVNAVSEMETPIPVIYAAVTDPEAAQLTGLDYVSGTSDALDTAFILDMMLAVNPEVKTVGLLYSNSEVNSAAPIAEAKEYLDAKGIAYVEKTGNTTDEIQAAVAALVGQVDAVFTPTDNVVMAAELSIYETLIEAGIPHYAGADSFVRNGAFATCGVNYTELGRYTADLVLEAVVTASISEDYHVMDGGIITVNTETAAALGADYSAFAAMADSVVEVATTQD